MSSIRSFELSGADQAFNFGRYHGFVVEATGDVVLAVRNGNDASDPVIETLYIDAGDALSAFYDDGIVVDGVFVDLVSGTITGSIRLSAEQHEGDGGTAGFSFSSIADGFKTGNLSYTDTGTTSVTEEGFVTSQHDWVVIGG